MTLREIIHDNPHLFYKQEWYSGESFLDREAEELPGIPDFEPWRFHYFFPKQEEQRVSAASLALLYVNNPDEKIWDRMLWTDDLDQYGNRVYIGGVNRTGLLEIHRHLVPDSNYGIPRWAA